MNPNTNEVFIADGYVNRRIIVFDSETGSVQATLGCLRNKTRDGPIEIYDPSGSLPRNFNKSHGVGLAKDGLVYASDRQRNRVQVFRTDGTFVNEVHIPTESIPIQTEGTGAGGSTWRTGFSADPEQRFLYIADMENSKVWILRRGDLKMLGSFDSPRAHHMAGADSKGNLYTTAGRSPQKFLLKGEPYCHDDGPISCTNPDPIWSSVYARIHGLWSSGVGPQESHLHPASCSFHLRSIRPTTCARSSGNAHARTAATPNPVGCRKSADPNPIAENRLHPIPGSWRMPHALHFLIFTAAGWLNRRQEDLIEYLREENRVLREQLKAAVHSA